MTQERKSPYAGRALAQTIHTLRLATVPGACTSRINRFPFQLRQFSSWSEKPLPRASASTMRCRRSLEGVTRSSYQYGRAAD